MVGRDTYHARDRIWEIREGGGNTREAMEEETHGKDGGTYGKEKGGTWMDGGTHGRDGWRDTWEGGSEGHMVGGGRDTCLF